ncbi:cytochrome P450 [Streptomyces sp. N2-109]|uniref:Cytochrome P450 n=1 Tax=Streptomyces gossypii TaxID=2883101 RepID=A0ABT2JNA7_9ACTN|nr:cytochrome P450 [Streptomyces gossypii]MCT2588994.1 cytochrome P450 [Streptomyces gossypii]
MTEPPLSATGCPILHGPGFAARPEDAYRQLRAAGPVGWAEIAPDVHALVVTRYRAARDLLNDTGTYSKDARRWRALNEGKVPEDSPVRGLMEFRPNALYAEGERHARLRWSMDDCLARVSGHQLREITRRSAQTLISRVAARGRADVMSDFADTLPLYVFAELLGCPDEFSARLVLACQGVINAGPEAGQAAADLAALLGELAGLKRQQPGQDFTSWMLGHPARLDEEEVVYQLFTTVGAGTIPTAAWMGWALRLLLRDDAYAGNLASGTLTVRRALEKALWTKSPMANFSVHFAREDTTLHGCPIPAGVPVMISHAAANTDPELPPDLGYESRAHLAWSAGPHRCPAVSQATTIAQTGIETILDRLWDMELTIPDDQITHRHGPFHQCPVTLPVKFRPKPENGTSPSANTPAWR